MQKLLTEAKLIDELYNINFNTRLHTVKNSYTPTCRTKFNSELKRALSLLQRLEIHYLYINELTEYVNLKNKNTLDPLYQRIKDIHEEAQDIYSEIKETKEYLEGEYANYIGQSNTSFTSSVSMRF